MATESPEKKNYKTTLNLPQTAFAMEAKLTQNEPKRLAMWQEGRLYEKLIADRATRKLVGAHLMGPQSSTLIQQLIQGMRADQSVDAMALDQYYIHPALPEVIENALLGLEFD